MEQMQYNFLFRWFVGLGIDDPVWVPTVFTKNRDRLLTTEMSRKVMAATLAHREVAPLLSDEHFSVDGALLHKSAVDWTSPFPGQTCPATSVIGVPRAVKPFRTATRTWNSAT